MNDLPIPTRVSTPNNGEARSPSTEVDILRQLSQIEQSLSLLTRKLHANGDGHNGSAPPTPTATASNGATIQEMSPPTKSAPPPSQAADLMTVRIKVPRNLGALGPNGHAELMTVPVKVPRMMAGAPSETVNSMISQGLRAASMMPRVEVAPAPVPLTPPQPPSLRSSRSSRAAKPAEVEELGESEDFSEETKIGRDISLRDVFYMIRERWMLGLALGILAGAGYAYWSLNRPKVYEASSEIVIEMQSEKVLTKIEKVENTDLAEAGYEIEGALQIHQKRLSSPEYRDLVMKTYSEVEKKAFAKPYQDELFAKNKNAAEKETLSDQQIFEKYFGGLLSVTRQKGSQFLTTSYRHRDPQVAQLAANRFAEHYSGFLNAETKKAHLKASTFLGEQVASLRKKIENAEREIQAYRKAYSIVESDEKGSLSSSKLDALGSQVTAAEVQAVDLEVQIQQIASLGGNANVDQLLEMPAIAKSAAVAEVKGKLDLNQQEFIALDVKYGARHPKIIGNRAAKKALETTLSQNVQIALSDLKNQLFKAQQQKKQLKDDLVKAETAHLKSGDPVVEFRVMQRSLELDKTAYDQLLSRMNETAIAGQLENTNVKVMQKAKFPLEPVIPNQRKTGQGALVLLLGCFFGLPIGIGFLDTRLKSFSEAQAYLGKECLGVVPERRKMKAAELAQCVLSGGDESVVEGFRNIYSAMDMNSKLAMPKAILVTSTAPGEGKSFVTSNLAATFARHGHRVLILDGDLRRPSQHKILGRKNEAGYLKWMKSDAPPPRTAEELHHDALLGLAKLSEQHEIYLLRTGGSTRNPSEIIEDPAFEQLFNVLRDHFDLIIVDTPPVGLFPDALFFANFTEESIYVCKHNGINRHKIKAALLRIDRSPSRVLGTVMNQLSASRRHQYGYGYRDYGYYHYGYKDYAKYYHRDEKDSD